MSARSVIFFLRREEAHWAFHCDDAMLIVMFIKSWSISFVQGSR